MRGRLPPQRFFALKSHPFLLDPCKHSVAAFFARFSPVVISSYSPYVTYTYFTCVRVCTAEITVLTGSLDPPEKQIFGVKRNIIMRRPVPRSDGRVSAAAATKRSERIRKYGIASRRIRERYGKVTGMVTALTASRST